MVHWWVRGSLIRFTLLLAAALPAVAQGLIPAPTTAESPPVVPPSPPRARGDVSAGALRMAPAPPSGLVLEDKKNDDATTIELKWDPSPDASDPERVQGYIVRRAESELGPYVFTGRVFGGDTAKLPDSAFSWKGKDRKPPPPPPEGQDPMPQKADPRGVYYYGVSAFGSSGESVPVHAGPITPKEYLLHTGRINVLIACVICAVCTLSLIAAARRKISMYIRPLAGLEAVDEAIGRATEMGKNVLFVAGLGGVDSLSTIAAMTILGRIARVCADHGTRVLVPCNDPMVMTAQREIVKQSYLEAGRADAFNEDDIFFTTNAQFAYVASVTGVMLRERPAANFYMGYFFAEALILAEAGAMSGAIQIVGTDAFTQLPFFVTTCDYTLMGEELYAATAYLSREPRLLGSLKAQDLLKGLLSFCLVAGVVCAFLAQFPLLKETILSKVVNWFETE